MVDGRDEVGQQVGQKLGPPARPARVAQVAAPSLLLICSFAPSESPCLCLAPRRQSAPFSECFATTPAHSIYSMSEESDDRIVIRCGSTRCLPRPKSYEVTGFSSKLNKLKLTPALQHAVEIPRDQFSLPGALSFKARLKIVGQ